MAYGGGGAKYAALGFEVAGAVGLGAVVGWWVDGRFGFGPWGVIVGVLVGVVAGMYLLVKEAFRLNK